MLLPVIITSWRICIFRAGPQDLPAVPQSVAHAIMLALIVQAVQFQLSLPLLPAIAQSIVAVVVIWAFTAGVLTMRSQPERVPQTASALLAFVAWLARASRVATGGGAGGRAPGGGARRTEMLRAWRAARGDFGGPTQGAEIASMVEDAEL